MQQQDPKLDSYAIKIMYTGDPQLLKGEVRSVYYKLNNTVNYTADAITQARRFFSSHGLPTLFSEKRLADHERIQIQGHLDRLSTQYMDRVQDKVEFFTRTVVWNKEKFTEHMRFQGKFQNKKEVKKRKNKKDMFTLLMKAKPQPVIMDDLNEQ